MTIDGKYIFTLIYVAIIAMVSFRVAVHPTSYTTHDSHHYLKKSDHIEEILSRDNSFDRLNEIKRDFSTWPIGYPLSIAIVSYVTKASPLVSSKIVNLLFVGFLFIILYRWVGGKAWFLALSFFSYGTLEVISETWSETPFIFFVFLLGYTISFTWNYSFLSLITRLTSCLILLFLFRYVGVIYVFIIAAFGIIHFLNKKKKLAYAYIISSLISTIFIFGYLYSNKLSSGYITGMQRLDMGHQSFLEFTSSLVQGLLNEFFIARNYSFNGSFPDWLFLLLTLLQGLVILVLIKNKKLLNAPFKNNTAAKSLLVLSLGYLVGIILLKLIIPIDAFDFRILFPFTAPLFVSFLMVLTDTSQQMYYLRVYKLIVIFMLISFMINLPKKYILSKVKAAVSIQNTTNAET